MLKYNGQVAWRFPIAFQCFFMIASAIVITDLPGQYSEGGKWMSLG
jgi:hypothetical protein